MRRRAARTTDLLLGSIVTVAVSLSVGGASADNSPRPNILLLVAEDMSSRVGAFGDAVAVTPTLDRLALQGVRYSNVYTTAGVCAPSRAALITGLHAISIGAQHMRSSSRPEGGYAAVPPPHVKAFPELLRAAGYYTYTDFKLDYQFSGTIAESGPISIWDDEGTDTHWRNRPAGRPFFGLINFQVTHESGLFPPLGSWPNSLTHFGMQAMRAYFFGRYPSAGTVRAEDVILPPYYPNTPTVRADLARHYDNIYAMDRQVGELLEQLEADGLADSTVVIWTTDHGDGLPRAKRELYDSGIRVPMIVRWPAALRPVHALPGSLDEQLVSFVDLAPTLLSLARAAIPAWLPGRDFLGSGSAPREHIYASRDRIDAQIDRQRAVRDHRYKYVRSWHPDVPGGHRLSFRDNIPMMRELWGLLEAGKLDQAQRLWFEAPGRERLYDTQTDPHELRDLSHDEDQQARLERMRGELDAWLARAEDTSQEPEDRMAERFWPGGVQPDTPPPELARIGDSVVVSNAVVGASSEYRTKGGAWQLYTQPFQPAPGSDIEARSVRYGWSESEATTLPFD